MVEQDTREIESITFSLFSAEQILNMSVCKVDNSKLGIDKSVKTKETGVIARLKTPDSRSGSSGTVYDPRMGTLENGVNCETCHQDVWKCPGHFGHIEFTEPIIHPLYYKQVTSFLKCFCIKCFQLLITRDIIYLNGLNRYKGSKRFEMILEKLDKVDICSHCSHPQPEIKFSSTDSTISMVYKQKTKDKIIIVLGVEEIRKIFDNISDEDVRIVGFDPALVHPRNFIMTMFLVLPPCFVAGTLVLTDSGYKAIEDVNPADKLYTHTGQFQNIKETFVTPYNGVIMEIRTAFHPHDIKCTPEHPFYVKKVNVSSRTHNINGKTQRITSVDSGHPECVKASDLLPNHFIGMKRNTNTITPEFTIQTKIGNYNGRRPASITKILDNIDEWFLIGYFLGDGWLDLGHKGRFFLVFHIKDENRIVTLLSLLDITFRYKKDHLKPMSKTVECHNYTLWHILKDLGHKANGKKIPYWVQDAPKESVQSFLDGYCLADGHYHARNQIQYTTVSSDIAFSVQMLYLKLGRVLGITYGKLPKNSMLSDGRVITARYRLSVVEQRKRNPYTFLVEDEYVWFKITSINIEVLAEEISVYNFEVEQDNSYTVENLLSHNCCRPYVITDGNMCDDDLTNQLVEIIKANNHLKPEDGVPLPDAKRQKYLHSLKFRVLTFFNNSQGKAKHTTNGRPIKGLKERLGGKSGQIRNNLMGKRATCPETPILMFGNGTWKRAEHIVVGDIVVGDDGLPRTVVNTVTGTSPLYTVKQSYGDNYNVSCEHLLTLKYSDQCQIYWRPEQSKYGGWSMKWYDRNFKIVKQKKVSIIPPISKDQAEINMINFLDEKELTGKKYNWCSNRKTAGTWRVNYTESGIRKSKEFPVVIGMTKSQAFEELEKLRDTLDQDPVIDIHIEDYCALLPSVRSRMLGIKLNVPIQWEKRDVKMDPRILGLWLGDGCSYREQITNPDQPIIDYVRKWTEEHGGDLQTYIGGNLQHGISRCGFLDLLRNLNLYNNKHIPEDYIVNDEETRLLVLAGLIDIDGSVEQEGRIVRITQCFEHKIILDGALRIARSLGFRASINERNTSWVGSDGLITTGRACELTISGEGIEKIPTLLPHKRCVSPINTDMSCYKIEVVEAGTGRFCGFEVDQNNRFLLGDFTVTHNCDQSARTVIGPDPTLKMGQLGMPQEMAEILTVPVQVANYNIDKMNEIVNSGKANFVLTNGGETRINLQSALYYRGTRLLHGDIIVNKNGEESVVNNGRQQLQLGERVKRNGEFLEKLRYPCKKEYVLKIGDIVERQLQDGDIVLLNRQPTLHKGSMMAQEVVVMPYKTLRFNLAIAKSFNADFDGDEMDLLSIW